MTVRSLTATGADDHTLFILFCFVLQFPTASYIVSRRLSKGFRTLIDISMYLSFRPNSRRDTPILSES